MTFVTDEKINKFTHCIPDWSETDGDRLEEWEIQESFWDIPLPSDIGTLKRRVLDWWPKDSVEAQVAIKNISDETWEKILEIVRLRPSS